MWAEITVELAPVSGVARMRVNSSCLDPLRCIATSGTGRDEAVAFSTVEVKAAVVIVWVIPVCLTIRADSEDPGVGLKMEHGGL